MNPPINFLPWRQQRRTAFLRFWLLMFVAPLLLAVGITLILRLTGSASDNLPATGNLRWKHWRRFYPSTPG